MKRFIAVLALGVAVAGVLGVLAARPPALVAGVAHPPAFERLLDYVPPFPGAYMFPMGSTLHVDGIPREMGWAKTDSSPAGVCDRYQALWHTQGLAVQRREQPSGECVVTVAGAMTRTVVAWRGDDGKTVLVASLSEPGGAREPVVPKPPLCRLLRATGARDIAVETEVAEIDCPLGIEELTRWYDDNGGERSAQLLPEPGSGALHATWTLGDEQVTVLATELEGGPPRTYGTVTWQKERP